MAMPVLVILPSALRSLFPGCPAEQRIEAHNVAEALEALNRLWPGMRDRLCDSSPAIRRHIHIFIDGEKADLNTRLTRDAEMFIMTAISGG